MKSSLCVLVSLWPSFRFRRVTYYFPNPLSTRSAMAFKMGRSPRSSMIIVILVPLVHTSVKISKMLDASAFSSSFCIQTFAIESWAMPAIWAAERACRPSSFWIVVCLCFVCSFSAMKVQRFTRLWRRRRRPGFRVKGYGFSLRSATSTIQPALE